MFHKYNDKKEIVMATISKKTKNKIRHQAKKEFKSTTKRISVGGMIAIALTLIVSVVAGVFVEKLITKNDCFVLSGEKEFILEVGAAGSTYTYKEEGFKAISFGKDLSDKVNVKTNMTKNDDGTYTIDTSQEGDYYLIYTIDSIKYGKIKRVRTFTVGAENE